MSSIVCQGLQSCLEPHVEETTTLRLRLAALKSLGLGSIRAQCSSDNSNNTMEMREKCHNRDLGDRNFLQNLSNSSQIPQKTMDFESTYVQPKVKSYSSLRLSEKSLEICTENLGSETGSDTSESCIFSPSEKSPTRNQENSRQFSSRKKANSHNFPPPLTTISGSNSLQVSPHREAGRLLIKAVEVPSVRTCFEAQRSHGRLKLRFSKNCEFHHEQKVASEETEESIKDEFVNDPNNEEIHEEDGEEFEDEEENGAYNMKKDMDGNNVDVEVEMGMENFERPSRCKEGAHGDKGLLRNWESFWVATS